MHLNRSRGHFLCCSFLHCSFVCVQSTKGSANKQDIHHVDRQNKLHTEENLNVSPRLIVSRPAAGEPALSPASVHPLGLLLDVRLTTRHRCEHSKLKRFKKHCCYTNTLFFSFFLPLHIQTCVTLSVKTQLKSFFLWFAVFYKKIILHMVKNILWKLYLYIFNIDWVRSCQRLRL